MRRSKQRLGGIITFSSMIGLSAINAQALDLDMARFATSKKAQTTELAATLTNKVPSIVWSYFEAVRVDDRETATNLSARLLKTSAGRFSITNDETFPPALKTAIWQPIAETIGAYDQFWDWDNKLLHRFGSNVIASIPKGSIYFGGTDPGRFIVSALSESQREGRPFFTVTQNQLADKAYLDYLQSMYGGKIYIPSTNDSQRAFQVYLADAQQRLQTGKLKPGEYVREVNGRTEVSGQVAVMQINGLLTRVIVEKNLDREFYIEESFPLDWMYPYLSPHGLIFELSHEPLKELPEETLQKDRDYWKKFVGDLIGDWITDGTSVKEICEFDNEIYLRKNLADFKGDPAYAKNKEAQMCFSKLRASIAGLYVWRMDHAGDEEKDGLRKAADLAYRQALACCPKSPEVIYRYSQFLVELKRTDDAILVVKTAQHIDPDNIQFSDLLRSLNKNQ